MQYVVMGVSGAGKSAVGAALADALGCAFVEGDDLHPPENIAKMAAGHPLDDADRAPWLDRIAAVMAERAADTLTSVVACSALRRAYRDRLRAGAPAFFIQLEVPHEVLAARLHQRRHHFMPATLLDSQLATFEPLGADEPGITIAAQATVAATVAAIRAAL